MVTKSKRPLSRRNLLPPGCRQRRASAIALCDLLMAAMFHVAHGQIQSATRCISQGQVAYQMCRRSSPGGQLPAPVYNAWAAVVVWTQRPTEINMAGFALGLITLIEWRYTDPTMRGIDPEGRAAKAAARASARVTA